MLRIVVADDHHLVRAGLRRLLEATGEVKVVGEAGTGAEAIHMVRYLLPDILLLDLTMPGGDGFEVLKSLADLDTGTRIIVVSAHDDHLHRKMALSSGAFSMISKSAIPNQFIDTIKRVAAAKRPDTIDEPSKDTDLTFRQLQVIRALATGQSNREIAAELGINVKTVDSHRGKLLKKLGLRNNADLVRFALREGIISG